ncbi:hypothetical protein DAPPUDRAFT_299859 [Daphnia pulex]|uniref:Uncharacterized protein n=1 Tax=Daphnia pulex TaxID=6669 RepID=E9FSB7_DAPPU|nr:hypothetical protein DAPPUDRAFT_299859 [Daphnia pulex]|eukprot:EFX90005.1 hypothetical protein DAPPUDRAFT_299859 [Daphnia pulex]
MGGGREDGNFFRLTEKEFANRKPKHATIKKTEFESKRQREKITFVSIIPTEKHKQPKKFRNSECIATHGQVTIKIEKLYKRKCLSITRFFFFFFFLPSPQPIRKKRPPKCRQKHKN